MSTFEIASLLDNSKDLDRLRKEQEDVLLEINKIHKKLQTSKLFAVYLDDSFLLSFFFFFFISPKLTSPPCSASSQT